MDLAHTQAKRLYDGIVKEAGREAAERVLAELSLGKTPSDAKKREWAKRSCEALCENFGCDAARRIRKSCHCKPNEKAMKQLRKLWLECDDAIEFARRANAESDAYHIEEDAGALVLVYPRCYCSFVKRAGDGVPKEWCDCSLGYAEEMFAYIEGAPVKAKLIKSVVLGDDTCRIRIEA